MTEYRLLLQKLTGHISKVSNQHKLNFGLVWFLYGPNMCADGTLSNLMKALSGGGTIPTDVAPGFKRAFLQDGVLCRPFQSSSLSSCHTQIVIPSSLQSIVLQQLHDNSGHLGEQKTVAKVKIGLDMKEIWQSGSKNVGNVSNESHPTKIKRHHWTPFRVPRHLKNFPGI